MKKLLQGIVKFRRDVLPGYRETFAKLALGQSPDVLFIGCSDSRVAVNVFASTDPGDLFVVRNVGNLVPPYSSSDHNHSNESVGAAIEFAVNTLKVSNIIICGHSECGAMQALSAGREKVPTAILRDWLQNGESTVQLLNKENILNQKLSRHNQLSQLNVLQQIEHLKTYPLIQEKINSNQIDLHAWWFELSQADVYIYKESKKEFILIDENEAENIIKKMKT